MSPKSVNLNVRIEKTAIEKKGSVGNIDFFVLEQIIKGRPLILMLLCFF